MVVDGSGDGVVQLVVPGHSTNLDNVAGERPAELASGVFGYFSFVFHTFIFSPFLE